MTTSNFPANTFSIYTGRPQSPALAAIAERQRRIHRWARPLAAAIVATAFTFTAVAAFRDGGASIEASWRDASRPNVTVRQQASRPESSESPPSAAAAPTAPSPAMVATLTGSVPGLLGPARTAQPTPTESAEPAPTPPEATAVPAVSKPAVPAAAKPSAPKPARAKVNVSDLDKLGSDITSRLK